MKNDKLFMPHVIAVKVKWKINRASNRKALIHAPEQKLKGRTPKFDKEK